jgi:monothiol glutaredoxin
MSRPLQPHVHPTAEAAMASFHRDVVDDVAARSARADVFVVGMAGNPHVAAARRALRDAGIDHEYLQIGSYLSKWRVRLAVKLWAGWPTFPMVWVRGTFIGGNQDLRKALRNGTVEALRAAT